MIHGKHSLALGDYLLVSVRVSDELSDYPRVASKAFINMLPGSLHESLN